MSVKAEKLGLVSGAAVRACANESHQRNQAVCAPCIVEKVGFVVPALSSALHPPEFGSNAVEPSGAFFKVGEDACLRSRRTDEHGADAGNDALIAETTVPESKLASKIALCSHVTGCSAAVFPSSGFIVAGLANCVRTRWRMRSHWQAHRTARRRAPSRCISSIDKV